MQNLGFIIAEAATAKGWSLSELSRQTGIGIGQISRIVNAKANPTVRTLEKIAAALEVDLIVSHAAAV